MMGKGKFVLFLKMAVLCEKVWNWLNSDPKTRVLFKFCTFKTHSTSKFCNGV